MPSPIPADGGMEFRVLAETDHFLAVEKPVGVHTAPLKQGEGGTLLEAVMLRYPEVRGVPGIKPVEPGLIHRLDRDTSGIVLIARTSPGFRGLLEQFQGETVVKTYVAVCRVQPEAQPMACASAVPVRFESRFAPMGEGRKRVRVLPLDAPPPRHWRKGTRRVYATEFRIEGAGGGLCLVRARILRGFRHQIRAHLAHLGLPIVGDMLYGREPPEGAAPARMYLHAEALEFRDPASGETVRILCDPPPGFAVGA